jgi:hypothetical protein
LEGDRFELLAPVIEDYEEKHWPIDRDHYPFRERLVA